MNLTTPFGRRDKPSVADGDAGFAAVVDRLHPSQLAETQVAALENGTLEFGDIRHRWAAVMEAWGHALNMGGPAPTGAPLACCRWFEPETGEEALVVITAGQRVDGGLGRAWQLSPGSVPREIPLNGLDVWTAGRLVPARAGLVLTRFGNARHYFAQTAVDAGTDKITLNCAPQLVDGDKVLLQNAGDVNPPAPLQPVTAYWVKVNGADHSIQFCDSPSLANVIDILPGFAAGQWYVEKISPQPGVGGNGALPLVLQPDYATGAQTVKTAWEAGFVTVPQAVDASIANAATLWLAPNHRFAAGQAVKVDKNVGASFVTTETYYIEPADNHHVYLHADATTAMLADEASRLAADAASADNALYPASFSGQPIVPLTEAICFKQRVIGINGRNNVAVSDPGDFLHFTPFTGALTAALGNGDPLTALIPLGDDTLLLSSRTQIIGITGLNDVPDNWQAIFITQEYGIIAPLTWVQIGSDVWGLSRQGVVSVRQTEFGKQQGTAVPVSRDIQRKFAEIDWNAAGQSCAAYFNNRYLLAVPLKNQEGTPKNNCVFVYNFVTQAWDHFWTGAALQPVQFARLSIGGEERLCWLNADGHVRYFDPDGHQDITALTEDAVTFRYAAAEIPMRAHLRAYTHQSLRQKQFQLAELVLDTLNAKWSLTAIREGVNERYDYRTDVAGDPAKYRQHATPDYAGSAEPERTQLPGREDYSVVAGAEAVPAAALYDKDDGTLTVATIIGRKYAFYPGNATQVRGRIPDPPGPHHGPPKYDTHTQEEEFVAQAATYVLTGPPGEVCTASLETGSDLLSIGELFEAHQSTLERVPLHEQARSLQLLFVNTQGSARLRGVYVEAAPEVN